MAGNWHMASQPTMKHIVATNIITALLGISSHVGSK
jgi:hypothetical protein